MTTEQNLNIDPRRLFNLGANLVAAAFIKQDANEAKKLFKELKQGDPAKPLLGGKKEFGCKDDEHDELLCFP